MQEKHKYDPKHFFLTNFFFANFNMGTKTTQIFTLISKLLRKMRKIC